MNDRINLQLGIIGATHQAESVISLLTGAGRMASNFSRENIHDALGDAETVTWALLKSIQKTKDDNWNARCSEIDRQREIA